LAEISEKMTGREARDRLASFSTFTSGSRELDQLLGGGFRAGRVVEMFGKSNAGKTQLAMQAVLEVATRGETASFIDTEGTFRPQRVQLMARARGQAQAGLLDRMEYLRVRTAAAQIDSVRSIAKRKEASPIRFVAIDTFTRNFSVDFPGRANLQSRQGALNVHLSEIARDAFLHERAYLLTNRITFSQTGGETRIGGRTMEELVDLSLHLERNAGGVTATRTPDGKAVRLGQIGDAGFL
jgi:DNA repair protein RadA